MRYDTTLKELLQDGTPQLWQELVGQSVKEYLTVELPSVQMRKPDFLARLDNGALFHLELQGSNETNMAWRVAFENEQFSDAGIFAVQI